MVGTVKILKAVVMYQKSGGMSHGLVLMATTLLSFPNFVVHLSYIFFFPDYSQFVEMGIDLDSIESKNVDVDVEVEEVDASTFNSQSQEKKP